MISISSKFSSFIETRNAVLALPIGVPNRIGRELIAVIAPALTRVNAIHDTALFDCIKPAAPAPTNIDLIGLFVIFAKKNFSACILHLAMIFENLCIA